MFITTQRGTRLYRLVLNCSRVLRGCNGNQPFSTRGPPSAFPTSHSSRGLRFGASGRPSLQVPLASRGTRSCASCFHLPSLGHKAEEACITSCGLSVRTADLYCIIFISWAARRSWPFIIITPTPVRHHRNPVGHAVAPCRYIINGAMAPTVIFFLPLIAQRRWRTS